jgi:CRISPR-associated protein Cas1
VLAERKIFSAYLDRAVRKKRVDEANVARKYWQLYFPSIGYIATGRERKTDSPPNQMLNYGYAVLASLCHRAILIHGLSPLLGVGHAVGYRSDPLVYDLMEPYRPFVDRMLARFLSKPEVDMDTWCRRVADGLREIYLDKQGKNIRLLNAVDISARSLAECYREENAEPLWLPDIETETAA